MAGGVDFTGSWKLDRNENWDGFASAVGMNFVARKMSGKSQPTLVIEQDDEKVEIEARTMMFTRHEVVYTGGEPFENKAMDGSERKNVASWDNAKLIVKSEPKDENSTAPKITTVRGITEDGELLTEIQVHKPDGDVVCKRWFKKQP